MAINNDDVKLFESQRLTDEEDGSGRVTGNEVVGGYINNLFQDMSSRAPLPILNCRAINL